MSGDWRRGEYLISTGRDRLDLAVIHGFLTNSYWASGITLATVKSSIEHSLPFGVYKGEQQVGFARVITDEATYAYLSDVSILEPFRGQGLSKWLLEVIVAHPDLQDLRLWTLLTRDAHNLYRKVGFSEPKYPERCMERRPLDASKDTAP